VPFVARPGRSPASCHRLVALHGDPLELVAGQLERLLRPRRRRPEPAGDVLRARRPIRVEIPAQHEPRRLVRGDLARRGLAQPAPRAGVGRPVAAVRAEAQDATERRGRDRLAPAWPQLLERGHHPLAGPATGPFDELLVELVDREVGGVGSGRRRSRPRRRPARRRRDGRPARSPAADGRRRGRRSRREDRAGRGRERCRAARTTSRASAAPRAPPGRRPA
jgi:hypothetical protein